MIAAVTITLDLQTVLIWILVGLVAGFLASRVMLGHGLGIVGDIVAGIVGAIAGGIIAQVLGITVDVPGHPVITDIIIAFVGAVIILAVLRLFRGRGTWGRRARF